MKHLFKQIFSYVIIILMALLLAANYYIFIIENNFAPAGLNGIATMIQYKTGFSISYMSLIVNIPLCVAAFFLISREYAFKSLLFTIVYSFSFLWLQQLPLDFLKYNAHGSDTIFPALISGVLSGVVCGISFKHNSSTGGTEILSKYISKVSPNTNFFTATFSLNAAVAIISLFVYSEDGILNYKPIALCITYCFVSTLVGNYIIRGTKTAYKFTVITDHPSQIISEITTSLKHGATQIAACGAYTGAQKTMLICVVNKHQLNDFQKILQKYNNTFSFYEVVNETYGNFKYIRKFKKYGSPAAKTS